MTRKFNVWYLMDKDGNIIIKGRKKDVENLAYGRYVYEHIFDDSLYRTDEKI